jgi:hypothetical protein
VVLPQLASMVGGRNNDYVTGDMTKCEGRWYEEHVVMRWQLDNCDLDDFLPGVRRE